MTRMWSNVQDDNVSEVIEPVKTVTQLSAVPTTTAYVASGAVPTSEADSCRIYGSSYSGVSFGSGFSPDNLLLTDRRPVRSRYTSCRYRFISCQRRSLIFVCSDLTVAYRICTSDIVGLILTLSTASRPTLLKLLINPRFVQENPAVTISSNAGRGMSSSVRAWTSLF